MVCTTESNLERHRLIIPAGTPLYGLKINSSGAPDEITILRAGIFDDVEILNEHKPEAEIYTNGRISWVNAAEGANQFTGMPPLP